MIHHHRHQCLVSKPNKTRIQEEKTNKGMEYSKEKLGHNMPLTYYTYILFIIFWLTQNCILLLSRTKQNIMGIIVNISTYTQI